MKKQSELSFKTVEFLRFPLIMVVVLIHCYYFDKTVTDVADTAPLTYKTISFLQKHIYSIAVPLFFFISGYLFFREGIPSTKTCLLKCKNRFRTIVIPYILWNTLGLGLFILKITLFSDYFPQYNGFIISVNNILKGFLALPYGDFQMPYDGSLWFIRNLIFITIATPIICLLFRLFKYFAIIIPIILTLLYPAWLYGFFTSLYFFMLGALLPVHQLDLFRFSSKTGIYALLLWSIGIIGSYFYSDISIFTTSFGILYILYLGGKVVNRSFSFPKKLTNSTFFIYAFHALYISVATRIVLAAIPPTNEIAAIISYIIIFLLLAGGSYIVYRIMNKISPKTLSIICGGRN